MWFLLSVQRLNMNFMKVTDAVLYLQLYHIFYFAFLFG